MTIRPRLLLGLVLTSAAVGVAACEPYMSMTDQIEAQTRQAAQLLPESPRYVGMVDVETVFRQLEELTGKAVSDRLDQMDHPRARRFLDATGLQPATDLDAVYGSLHGRDDASVVVFGAITADQLDEYVDQAPEGAARTTSYREVPLYHLTLGRGEGPDSSQTITLGVVEDGMIAGAMDPEHVRSMVDRHRAPEDQGLRTNSAYMALIKRVGRGRTTWLAGRDVVESAFEDTTHRSPDRTDSSEGATQVSRASVQRALSKWSDRVLGLSNVSSLEGRAQQEMNELKRKLREQAVSLTLTGSTLEGEVYLTMRDNSSASSVVAVAEGAVALMKLSEDDLEERHRDLIDGIEIDREGVIVHIHFSVDRETIRDRLRDQVRATVHRFDPLVRQLRSTVRRTADITDVSVS